MLLNPPHSRKSPKKRVSIKSKGDGKEHPERKSPILKRSPQQSRATDRKKPLSPRLRTGNNSPTSGTKLARTKASSETSIKNQTHNDNITHFKKLKKEVNAELHYLKYQLKNAEQKNMQLQLTCDQQVRELEKSRAARSQLLADVKSLTEHNKQLAKGLHSSPQEDKVPQKDRKKTDQKPIVIHDETDNLNTEFRHGITVPAEEFKELLGKYGRITEDLGKIKTHLKHQEEAFRDLQMELSSDQEVKMITEDIQTHQQHSQFHRLELQLERIINSYNNTPVITTPHKYHKPQEFGPPCKAIATPVRQMIPDADISILENMLKERTVENTRLKDKVEEQQKLIDEQWKLLEHSKEEVAREKALVEKSWKLKVDELEGKIKEAEEQCQTERDLHHEGLQNVKSTAKTNIDKLRVRLDELVKEMRLISIQQDQERRSASTLMEENVCLKNMIHVLRKKSKERKDKQLNPQQTACLAIPRVLYEDDLLIDVLDELPNMLANQVVLQPMTSHEISRDHDGLVILPVIASPAVASDIHDTLDAAQVDNAPDVAVVLILHQLTPSHSAMYTATRNRLRDPEVLNRCRAIVDLVYWKGLIYDCEVNTRGLDELAEIIEGPM